MKQFSLRLNKNSQRPIARLDTFHNYDAMLDTGSVFPMWVKGEDILQGIGGQLIMDRVQFSGFGGSSEGKLYRLEMVQIGELFYPGLNIISCRIDIPCYMILSATMFHSLIYEVDDYNHSLNFTIPDKESAVRNLKIWDSKGKLHVACQSAD